MKINKYTLKTLIYVYFINIFYIVITQFIIFDKDFSDEVLVHWKLIRQGQFILIIFRKFDVATIKLIVLLLFAFILTALENLLEFPLIHR